MRYLILGFMSLMAWQAYADNLPPWAPRLPSSFNEVSPTVAASSDVLPPWSPSGRWAQPVTDVAVVEEIDEDVAVVEELPEDTGSAEGRADPCVAVAKSPGAVGEPCMTTRDFMASLGLSEAQMQDVEMRSGVAH